MHPASLSVIVAMSFETWSYRDFEHFSLNQADFPPFVQCDDSQHILQPHQKLHHAMMFRQCCGFPGLLALHLKERTGNKECVDCEKVVVPLSLGCVMLANPCVYILILRNELHWGLRGVLVHYKKFQIRDDSLHPITLLWFSWMHFVVRYMDRHDTIAHVFETQVDYDNPNPFCAKFPDGLRTTSSLRCLPSVRG